MVAEATGDRPCRAPPPCSCSVAGAAPRRLNPLWLTSARFTVQGSGSVIQGGVWMAYGSGSQHRVGVWGGQKTSRAVAKQREANTTWRRPQISLSRRSLPWQGHIIKGTSTAFYRRMAWGCVVLCLCSAMQHTAAAQQRRRLRSLARAALWRRKPGSARCSCTKAILSALLSSHHGHGGVIGVQATSCSCQKNQNDLADHRRGLPKQADATSSPIAMPISENVK